MLSHLLLQHGRRPRVVVVAAARGLTSAFASPLRAPRHDGVTALRASALPLLGARAWSSASLADFLKLPRGFGHGTSDEGSAAGAAPKEGSAAAAAEAATGAAAGAREATGPNKRGGKRSGSGKGSGSGGGGGDDEEVDPWAVAALVGLAGAAAWYFWGPSGPAGAAGQEVSWQEFRNNFLVLGLVDRLEVVNKEVVRVFLRGAPHPAFGVEGGGGGGGAGVDDRGAGGGLDGSEGGGGQQSPELLAALAQARSARGALHFRIGSVESFERQLEDAQLDVRVRPRDFVPVRHVSEATASRFAEVAMYVVAFSLYVTFMRMMGGLSSAAMGGGGGRGAAGGGGARDAMSRMFSIGKVKPPVAPVEGAGATSFKDVAGCDEAKAEIQEFVQFLKDPARFTALGAKIPKGALLVGPPGTGKTLLAKATAGEAGVPFFSMSGSDFLEMFVGVGPARVRDLFAQAREKAPCIVFIDEIDAVARARGKGKFGGSEERENTLNQLLVEMDGFASSEGVLVMAGTNRVDILDKAILRPGRFDRHISVDKPDIKGRFELFSLHMRGLKLAPDTAATFAQRLASLTPGFVGADVANICNEAAIHAARGAKAVVDMADFEAAIDRVIGGFEKRNSLMSPTERRTVAFHEAGHAVAGWFLEHADPLLKVTIIPRANGALGFAQYLPKEVSLFTTEALKDRMCMALGGRAAEELTFGRITTGASDDLNKVTQIAYAMTTVYGMNAKVGRVSFPRSEETQFDKPYSEALACVIDDEVRTLVDACYARTLDLLRTHADAVRAVAELLLERETIDQNDLQRIAGARPAEWTQLWAPKAATAEPSAAAAAPPQTEPAAA